MEILYKTFFTENNVQCAAYHSVSSFDFHQRAGWWWKSSMRLFLQTILQSELLYTTLVLATAIRGQVGGGNLLWDLFHRTCFTAGMSSMQPMGCMRSFTSTSAAHTKATNLVIERPNIAVMALMTTHMWPMWPSWDFQFDMAAVQYDASLYISSLPLPSEGRLVVVEILFINFCDEFIYPAHNGYVC